MWHVVFCATCFSAFAHWIECAAWHTKNAPKEAQVSFFGTEPNAFGNMHFGVLFSCGKNATATQVWQYAYLRVFHAFLETRVETHISVYFAMSLRCECSLMSPGLLYFMFDQVGCGVATTPLKHVLVWVGRAHVHPACPDILVSQCLLQYILTVPNPFYIGVLDHPTLFLKGFYPTLLLYSLRLSFHFFIYESAIISFVLWISLILKSKVLCFSNLPFPYY